MIVLIIFFTGFFASLFLHTFEDYRVHGRLRHLDVIKSSLFWPLTLPMLFGKWAASARTKK